VDAPPFGEPPATIVNVVNESRQAVATDATQLANRLRPVLLKLNRELRRELRSLGLGVSPGQVSLLVAIKQARGIGARELAAEERMSPAGMSGHIDRLEHAGLVRRVPDAVDRRRQVLTLTAAGQRILRSVRSRRTAWLTARLERLDPEELDAVDAAIEPLQRLLEGAR
jgi:DNA-binding MarR family transcriptional regulator